MMNEALLTLYAYIARYSVHFEDHKRCCKDWEWEKDKLGFKWDDRDLSSHDAMLQAMVTITSIRLGRRPVALIRDPGFPHLDLVIASEQAIGHTPRADIERYLGLLAKLSLDTNSQSDASNIESELLLHAYRMCREAFKGNLTTDAKWLDPALPQITKAIEVYTAEARRRVDEDNEHDGEDNEAEEDEEAKEDEIDNEDDNELDDELDEAADDDTSRKVVSHEVDILTRAQSAISSLIAYRDAADPDAEDALVPQLHRDLTGCISKLYDKRDFKVMNNVVNGGIRVQLAGVSFLSRALNDLIHGARRNKGLRALLNRGVRCHWVPPTPPKAVSIVLDAPSLKELRSSLPALQEAVFDRAIPDLERKLKAGERYPTNRNITHNSITAPATFDVQVSAHCEVALISHLASRNIPTTVYIASALPPCYACHLLVESMEELEGCNTFQLGPYNGVIDCGWEFPSALPHADDVQKTMLRKLNDQLKEIIDRYQSALKPYVEDEWGNLTAREL